MRLEVGLMSTPVIYFIHDFFRSEDGPTTTEYAVMLALVIAISIGAISGIGETIRDTYTALDNSVSATMP